MSDDLVQMVLNWANETDAPEGSVWWLSFADPERPEGTQFLGACLVEAPNMPAAVTKTHILGINPGGEVAILGPVPQAPPSYPLDRLLSKDELLVLEEKAGGHLLSLTEVEAMAYEPAAEGVHCSVCSDHFTHEEWAERLFDSDRNPIHEGCRPEIVDEADIQGWLAQFGGPDAVPDWSKGG